MLQEILKSFILIFIAEMGDKTQILAMAFATRYPIKKVLMGIGIGVFLNHGLAVLLGSYLSQMVPIRTIQMIAGIAFVGFALWTLKSEDEEEEKEHRLQFGPIATVAIAFFLGELGDKTQLTAITLAADATFPSMILAGTVLGMVGTGAIGIIVGKKLGDKIPELGIKLLAASIFMFFGLQKLSQTVPNQYMKPHFVVPFIGVLTLIVYLMVRTLLRKRKMGINSNLVVKSKILYEYYQHLKEDLGNICMGNEYCSVCQGNQCAIGYAKEIIQNALTNSEWQGEQEKREMIYLEKPFIKEDVLDSLVDTLCLIGTMKDKSKLNNAHLIRNQLEVILLGQTVYKYEDINSYIEEVRKIDHKISGRIDSIYRMRNSVKVFR